MLSTASYYAVCSLMLQNTGLNYNKVSSRLKYVHMTNQIRSYSVDLAYLDSLQTKNSWAVQIKLLWTKTNNMTHIWDNQGSLRFIFNKAIIYRSKIFLQETFIKEWSDYIHIIGTTPIQNSSRISNTKLNSVWKITY